MAVEGVLALREVTIEALGDDFSLVSGQWLQGPRVASHLARARRVWAFATAGEEAVPGLIRSLAGPDDEWIIGITPGRGGWREDDRGAVEALLGIDLPQEATAGLLLAQDAPNCGRCPGTGCALCDATNAPQGALDGQTIDGHDI